jgi:hypothetical protein
MTVKAHRGGGVKKKVGTPRVSAPSAPRRPYTPATPTTGTSTGPAATGSFQPR